MDYKIKEITGSKATVEYSDGSWAELDINSNNNQVSF